MRKHEIQKMHANEKRKEHEPEPRKEPKLRFEIKPVIVIDGAMAKSQRDKVLQLECYAHHLCRKRRRSAMLCFLSEKISKGKCNEAEPLSLYSYFLTVNYFCLYFILRFLRNNNIRIVIK